MVRSENTARTMGSLPTIRAVPKIRSGCEGKGGRRCSGRGEAKRLDAVNVKLSDGQDPGCHLWRGEEGLSGRCRSRDVGSKAGHARVGRLDCSRRWPLQRRLSRDRIGQSVVVNHRDNREDRHPGREKRHETVPERSLRAISYHGASPVGVAEYTTGLRSEASPRTPILWRIRGLGNGSSNSTDTSYARPEAVGQDDIAAGRAVECLWVLGNPQELSSSGTRRDSR